MLLLILVVFLLSNRDPVGLTYWPFGLVITVPLGGVVLTALAIGLIAGLSFHLPKRLSAHRRAKRAEKRVAELEGKLALPPQPSTP